MSRSLWTTVMFVALVATTALGWILRGYLEPGARPGTPASAALSPDEHAGAPEPDSMGEHATMRDQTGGEHGGAGEHAGHAAMGAPPSSSAEEPRIAIEVPPIQQARIGLRVATIERASVHQTIRTVATIEVDQRLEAHVHTRLPGYIERIYVDAVGDEVKRGQLLYRLYSPEVVTTEAEYVAAAGRGSLSAMVAKAALDRLALWEVPHSEIERLKRTREVSHAIPFTAPVRGVVLDKTALRGMYVMPAMELYHIADLSTVWAIVVLYEDELALVSVGDPLELKVVSAPDRRIHGTIGFIYPDVTAITRTARARVELDNADGSLRPGMYAFATIEKDLGEALVVPDDAVIDTGVRKLVFVHTEGARFTPREVELGPRVSAGFVVRRGLHTGEQVVVRASFLIDAESRLQAALARTGVSQGHHH